MKIFLSWSGALSHEVAIVFREWLPLVIQTVQPYVSSEDIAKGARWSTNIAKELETSDYGILFVTRDNINAPWLNFEAGALSTAIEKKRVSPFLFEVDRSEVNEGPIHQFQSTIFEKEELRKLLKSINEACGSHALDEERLNKVFEQWWFNLEIKLRELVLGQENALPSVAGIAESLLNDTKNPERTTESSKFIGSEAS